MGAYRDPGAEPDRRGEMFDEDGNLSGEAVYEFCKLILATMQDIARSVAKIETDIGDRSGVRIGPVHTPECGFSVKVRGGQHPGWTDCTCPARESQQRFEVRAAPRHAGATPPLSLVEASERIASLADDARRLHRDAERNGGTTDVTLAAIHAHALALRKLSSDMDVPF